MYNAQGDVVGLADSSGKVVVEYTYDAWGNPLSITGTLANTLGQFNPLRYRGYVWDNETGLYYLQSRYYNPSWGRWINGDSQLNPDTCGKNLFAYCNNNPVNMLDSSGCAPMFYCETLKHGGTKWHFLMDNQVLNVAIGVLGFIPFGDTVVWGATELISGNRRISDDSLSITGGVTGTLGFIGKLGKVAKVSGYVSTVLAVYSVSAEIFSDSSYINEITAMVFRAYYESRTFDETAMKFNIYAAITRDLVNKGIITYEKKMGRVANVKVNWNRYKSYMNRPNTYYDSRGYPSSCPSSAYR